MSQIVHVAYDILFAESGEMIFNIIMLKALKWYSYKKKQ